MNTNSDTQDTYPPLPKGEQMASGLIGGKFVQLIRYSEDDMRAYVDADRTLRAGQSEPVAHDPKLPAAAEVLVSDLTKIRDKCRPGYMVSKFVVGWITDSLAIAKTIQFALGGAGQSPTVPTAAERDVLAERKRQVSVEGWTPEHDDEHDNGELARAAAAYACPKLVALENVCVWPWGPDWWKPKDARSNLVKACALGIAEIERLDRAALRSTLPQTTGGKGS